MHANGDNIFAILRWQFLIACLAITGLSSSANF